MWLKTSSRLYGLTFGPIFTILVLLVFAGQGSSSEEPLRIHATEGFYLAINNGSFDETLNSKDTFEFIASIEGMPDLPNWMFYRFPNESRYAYLYGTPPQPGNFNIEVIALNKRTFDTYRDVVRLQVLPRQNHARHEIQIRLTNLNVEDMFNTRRWNDFLSIFREILWKESQDVYLTKVVSPRDIGGSLPANPREKEGVIIRVGSTDTFSRDLLDLEREVEPIKNRSPCPSRYKFTRVEHYFRGRQFICDWCSFKIIRDSKIPDENTVDSDQPMKDLLFPEIRTHSGLTHLEPFSYKKRDYHDDLLYCIYLPLALCFAIVIILCPILLTKDKSRPPQFTQPELIRYQSIERATSQLRDLSIDRSNLPSSPATLQRTRIRKNNDSRSFPNLIGPDPRKDSMDSQPASVV